MSSEDDEKKQREREDKKRQNELRKQIDVDGVWNQLEWDEKKTEREVDVRPGWKTVRIFVSSTFKDFHQEREVLIKEIFADLRAWCQERKLHLIDCDLRWGVPKETTSEVTLRTCLEEIDRCYKNNKVPYFVNMTCKRIGWIPLSEELPSKILSDYRLIFGLSVTEMEIVHAAYRIENPNALFLIRDDSFLKQIKDESVLKEFVDELQPIADKKLEVLKDKIMSRFPDRVKTYKCDYVEGERLYTDYTGDKGRPKLKLDENFSKIVLNFFKERISEQYPPVITEVDTYQEMKYDQESFMSSRCEMFFGREKILQEISDYIESDTTNLPKLIVGEAGAGKSSLMAKAVHEMLDKVENKQLKHRGLDWTVLYHFVGAVPNSTDLLEILRRILKEIQPNQDLPETLEETVEAVRSELSRESDFQKPIAIFIDAINQISKVASEDTMTFWLPKEKLSSKVRCVFSVIDGSDAHRALQKRMKGLTDTKVPDLEPNTRGAIVENYLGQFNKKLDNEQLVHLVLKESSKNPLWLRIACEELRIYGDFATLTTFLEKLPDGLQELLKQVLRRFANESDKVLLESTLCLLETSQNGLLEGELLEILGDKKNLEYKEMGKESTKFKKGERLPAVEWAAVFRHLRTYLRPFGNPSEGRLDFYHRTLSKVVREMYLGGENQEEKKKRLRWWHQKLADFYCKSGTYDRKVEEYPYHLIQLKKLYAKDDVERKMYADQLAEFLCNMQTVKRLYDHEFSGTLLYYWRECGDESYDRMTTAYMRILDDMKGDPSHTRELLSDKYEEISRLLTQAGKYKEGLELANECLRLIEQLPTSFENDDRRMYILGHKAHIMSLLLPRTQSASEIPELEAIIKLHSDAIAIIRGNDLLKKDRKYKKYMALQLIKTAYARGGIANRCGIFQKKLKKESTVKGLGEVDEAIKHYKEIGDFGHELEAQLTKATLYRGQKDKQLEIYEETKKRCEDQVGTKRPLMCRLCYNMGVVYGRDGDKKNAYKYHKQAYDIAKEIYGTQHFKTDKYRQDLLKYSQAAKQCSESID